MSEPNKLISLAEAGRRYTRDGAMRQRRIARAFDAHQPILVVEQRHIRHADAATAAPHRQNPAAYRLVNFLGQPSLIMHARARLG